jgi:hypothetical protein
MIPASAVRGNGGLAGHVVALLTAASEAAVRQRNAAARPWGYHLLHI